MRQAPLVAGPFTTSGEAHALLDALLDKAATQAELDVALLRSNGAFLVVAQARDERVRDRVASLLRTYGASVSDSMENTAASDEAILRQWRETTATLARAGVVAASDLLEIALAPGSSSTDADGPSATTPERKQRLTAADAELRSITNQLTARMRERHPELFDKRGNLRKALLRKRAMDQLGGKRYLSGDELDAIQAAGEVELIRPERAS